MNTNEIPKAHPELLEALHRQVEKAQQMKLSQDFTEKVMEKVKSTPKKSSLFTLRSSLQKIAAISLAAVFLSGIALAAWHIFSPAKEQPTEQANCQSSNVKRQMSTPVRFSDVRLDSLLTVVSSYYGKAVRFRDEELREMKIITSWNPADSLTTFIDHLNMFDYLHLTLQEDTIFVESVNDEEDE